MFYAKNLPKWERSLRMLVGLIGGGLAFISWGTSTPGLLAGLACASIAVTGLFGFCPMCAMVGRKISRE